MKKYIMLLVFLLPGSMAFATTIDLVGTIRDFSDAHPDMEYTIAAETGIVEETLGADGKPVYASPTTTVTTTGKDSFDQWYNNVEGVNKAMEYVLTLDNTITPDLNVYTFSSSSFFPIDGMLLGNEKRSHNYHFTYELHTDFTYHGGEFFNFTGDDDLWLFINDRLVVDLGGVHGATSKSVDLDTLELTLGATYGFDLFFAERHTTESNFRIDTSILVEPTSKPVPEPATMFLLGSGMLGLVASGRRFKK